MIDTICVYAPFRFYFHIHIFSLAPGSSSARSLILKGWRRDGVCGRAWLSATAMGCRREGLWAASLRKAKNPIWGPLQSDLGAREAPCEVAVVMGFPQNGCCTKENSFKMDDLGVPSF